MTVQCGSAPFKRLHYSPPYPSFRVRGGQWPSRCCQTGTELVRTLQAADEVLVALESGRGKGRGNQAPVALGFATASELHGLMLVSAPVHELGRGSARFRSRSFYSPRRSKPERSEG